jgi:threonine/homoserine/homoserine lactone efflux protein
VALAPLVGDVFVIACCLLLLAQLPSVVFALLGVGGGLYVLFLGWETLKIVPVATVPTAEAAGSVLQSLRRGLVVNLLNPHPYLFWLTVGGPLVLQSYDRSAFSAILMFLGGFYGCLVGSKVLLALLIHSGRARLQSRGYRLTLQLSGMLLLVLGGRLVWEGIGEYRMR